MRRAGVGCRMGRVAARRSSTLHPRGIAYIDQPGANPALRIEWGLSQRDYIEGNELRMRLEVGLSPSCR